MPIDIHTLLADSTVATAPSPATSGTSLTLTTGEGARFPSTGSFDVLICPSGAVPIWANGAVTGGNFEVCRATRSGDVLTLTRAQYATTARTVIVSDRVFQPVMPHDLTDITSAYATTLPASPSDGQVATLVDSTTNPTYQWQFRYNAGSSSAYKWEFVGGPPFVARVETSESTTGIAIVDLATVGPQMIAPRAGDYAVRAVAVGNSATAGNWPVIQVTSAGATAVPGTAVTIPVANYGVSLVSEGIIRAVTASTAVKIQYNAAFAGQTVSFSARSFAIVPVRVS